MCSKLIPYFIKWIIGFVMTVIGIGVIMSIFFSGGSSEANVEMKGEDNKSVIQQSAGFHVLELNNSGDCQGWTWTEYALVILGFIFILKVTHLLHYCFVTKAIVKRKVSKI
jgi:hypothetical protein